MTNSSLLSTASAIALFVGGLVLLFASDSVLPALEPTFGPPGFWIGQLLAAALLALGFLNYMNRSAILGGIYGRPVVMANTVFYFVGGISSLQLVIARGMPIDLSIVTVVLLVFAIAYGLLLFRGPFGSDRPTGTARQPAS